MRAIIAGIAGAGIARAPPKSRRATSLRVSIYTLVLAGK
jgi:hypothetical protein